MYFVHAPRLSVLALLICVCIALAAQAGTITPDQGTPIKINTPSQSPWVTSDSTLYPPGSQVGLSGGNFGAQEVVSLQVSHQDGSPSYKYGPLTAVTDANGAFRLLWELPASEPVGETLLVVAQGQATSLTAQTILLASPSINLDQLQNGTATTAPAWSNGNINSSNSCYEEANSVPYRYFVSGTTAGTKHYFTISMEWTKGGKHAIDYITTYDLSEAGPIASAGGPCGPPSPPVDCNALLPLSYPLPNFLLTSNYTGTIPSDFFTTVNPLFVLDGPGALRGYNATIDSIGKMYFGGSSSDRTLNIPVYFTTTTTASAGFYWGGHLASSAPTAWLTGNGSGSVSGAPYHMRVVDFDGGGGKNQDRSIQNGSICLPPTVSISCTPGTTLCKDSVYSCAAVGTANTYTWTVTGGTIQSGQGTSTVTYKVTAAAGGTVTVDLAACNASTACPGEYCCSYDTVTMAVVTCNICPVATCHGDTTVNLCTLGQVCIPGFSCSDANGNLVSCTAVGGTLVGNSMCFTPTGSGVYTLKLIALDGDGCADTCETKVTVHVNQAPVASCHGDTTLFVCSLSQICLPGFGATDPDGNLKSVSVTGGTLSGNTVCFTPTGTGVYTIRTIAVDSCDVADTCEMKVTVNYNRPPDASCPGNLSLFVCSLSPMCIHGFSATDPDGNLTGVSVNTGTLAGDSVCFTPVAGVNTIRLIATDACGKADTCTTIVTVTVNAPPDIALGADKDTFLCTSGAVCVGYSVSDPNGMGKLTETLVSGPAGATLDTVNNKVCFTPSAIGSYSVTVRVADSCGAADEDTQVINVTMNRPPEASCHSDTTMFMCSQGQVCLSGYGATDPDGNLKSVSVVGGTLTGGTVCFTPVASTNTVTLIAVDSCGLADTCVTTVTVNLNQPPMVQCHADTTIFVCSLGQICLPGFGSSDPDGNLKSTIVTGGTYSGGSVCFTPVIGANTIILTATDSCGASASCTTTVTVALNNPPVATCPGNQTVFVCDLSQLCIDGFGCNDPDGNGTGSTVSLGTLSGSQVCFTPTVGPNTIRLICTDACGKADTCETVVTVVLNSAPDVALGTDLSLFQCAPTPVCVPYTVTDLDNNVIKEELLSGPAGAVIDTAANTVCLNNVTTGSFTIIVKVTDACGLTDQDDQVIKVTLNQPPVVTLRSDTAYSLCQTQNLCFPYTVADPDGLDGLVEALVSGPSGATIDTAANQVCFSPSASGSFSFIVSVTDPCGASDVDTVIVQVTLNGPPVLTLGADKQVRLCTSQQVCESYTVSDPNGLAGIFETLVSGPAGATLDTAANKVCFTPTVTGTYTFIVRAADQCGATDQDTVVLSVVINVGPVVDLKPDSSYYEVCIDVDSIVCLNYTVSDPDGVKIVESLVGGAATIDTATNTVCLAPNASGKYYVVVKAMDSCGAIDLDTAIVVVKRILCCPSVTIEKVHNALQGMFTCVDITMQGNKFAMGGLNLLIAYDGSALTPNQVLRGSLLTGCKWEYFTYRFGADGNCSGSGCPSGLLRIVAIAETNNGANHPICFGPTTKDTVQIAQVCFLVSNDRTLECQFTPIRFFWTGCGDNAFSTKGGDTLILSDLVYDYDRIIPINDGAAPLPSIYGAPDYCAVPYQPNKPAALRCIDFYNGGVDIVCADSIDARGDVNMNGLGYEIADAVLFSRYFVYGNQVWTPLYMQGQIAATDVNADGLVLTVADLVYLIRVIIGDEPPYSKLTPVSTTFANTNGTLSVGDEMGGALVVVKGRVTPELLAGNMRMMYDFDGADTRILIYPSPEADHLETFSGAFLTVSGELVSVEFGSSAGAVVEAKLVPNTYRLSQNYPNPFNPSTTIEYNLPVRSRVVLSVFDVLGHQIRTLVNGEQSAGPQKVEWNGRDERGRPAASGVYFFRLEAGGFNATKKMVLLK